MGNYITKGKTESFLFLKNIYKSKLNPFPFDKIDLNLSNK